MNQLVQVVAVPEWNSDGNGFVSTEKLTRPRWKLRVLSAGPMVTDHTRRSPLSMALKNHNYKLHGQLGFLWQ